LIENGSPIDDPDLVEYVRTYRLATEPFCLPPSVQEDEAAVTLDWLLKIHEAAMTRMKRESGG
jgi:hypothetical protein